MEPNNYFYIYSQVIFFFFPPLPPPPVFPSGSGRSLDSSSQQIGNGAHCREGPAFAQNSHRMKITPWSHTLKRKAQRTMCGFAYICTWVLIEWKWYYSTCDAVWCNVLQSGAVCWPLRNVRMRWRCHYSICVVVWCSLFQCGAVCCSVLAFAQGWQRLKMSLFYLCCSVFRCVGLRAKLA